MAKPLKKPIQTKSPIKSDKLLRRAGQSLEEMKLELATDKFLTYMLVIFGSGVLMVWESVRWFTQIELNPLIYFAAFVMVSTICGLRMRITWNKLNRMRLGLEGERAVGQYLDTHLRSEGFEVFHDVPGDDFNIDHLIICQHGIFAIETKTRSVPVDGEAEIKVSEWGISFNNMQPRLDDLKQARKQARWLKELLEEHTGRARYVLAVLLYPGWQVMGTTEYQGSWVLEPRELLGKIKAEKNQLSSDEITEVCLAVRMHLASRRST